MYTIDEDLHHQESYQNVCYQAPHIIYPDNQDAEFPITISNEREKTNDDDLKPKKYMQTTSNQ